MHSIKTWEIEAFIESILILHIYQISPTALWEAPENGWYKTPLMTHDRFSFILNKLQLATKDANPDHNSNWKARSMMDVIPDMISALRELGSQSRELTYQRELTTISLDDEKERMRSHDVYGKGVARIFQRSGNPGPTIYAGVSKNTGMILSAEMQAAGESTQSCAKRALSSKHHAIFFELQLLKVFWFSNFIKLNY